VENLARRTFIVFIQGVFTRSVEARSFKRHAHAKDRNNRGGIQPNTQLLTAQIGRLVCLNA
jgi:hypothetical protein